jgi:hypothetical protein
MEDGSRPVLPINYGGSQEEVGIDDEDWEYVQEEQAEAVALVHGQQAAGYGGVTSPSSSTSTSINTRARDVEEGAATSAREEDDGTGSGRRKAIKLLKDLATVPGKVEDVIVYKQQKLQRKPRVVYLKTVLATTQTILLIILIISFISLFWQYLSFTFAHLSVIFDIKR